MRVLLISYHFEPSAAIGARRATSLAAHLERAGHEVHVICGPAQGQGAGPGEFRGTVNRVSASVRAEDLVRTTVGEVDKRPGVHLDSFIRRLRRIAREVIHVPDPQIRWSCKAMKGCFGEGQPTDADVILVSGPPFSSFLLAAYVAKRLGRPWVADYRDLWSMSSYYPYSWVRRWFDRRFERGLLRSAAAIVTVSEPLARDQSEFLNRLTSVVRNGADLPPRGLQESESRPGLHLIHTGEIYEGKRDPEPLLRAFTYLDSSYATDVHLHVAGRSTQLVLDSARKVGCLANVVDHGLVTHGQSVAMQCAADALVLLMWNDPREEGVYSGKLFEYLVTRRPIIMVGYEHGVAADLLRERRAGVTLNDPELIAEHLMQLLEQKRDTGRVDWSPSSALEGITRDSTNAQYTELLLRVVKRLG